MTKETIDGIVVLHADDGAFLTNGDAYSQLVYLGKDADESVWRDATAEEYEEWKRQQEEDTPDDPETYPAWDIRSSTSFAVGDRVTSEGTVYECIKAHNASWTRQPPNSEYWRTV